MTVSSPYYTDSAPTQYTDVPGSGQQSAADQIVRGTFSTPAGNTNDGGGGGGSDFSIGEGVGIATSLLPLVSLFTGSKKSKAKAKPVARRPIQKTVAPVETSEGTNLLLLGGGALLILGVGIFAMSR